MNQIETLKLRMNPESFLLETIKQLMEEIPAKIRIVRLSESSWNDLRGCLPFYKQCPAFDNVLLLNEIFVCSVDGPLPLGPEFVDCDGNTFLHPDFSESQ